MISAKLVKKLNVRSVSGFMSTLKKNGVGRTLTKLNSRYNIMPYLACRKLIRLSRISLHFIDFLERKWYAKKIVKTNTIKKIPQKEGFRQIDKNEISGSDRVVRSCQEHINKLPPERFQGEGIFILPLYEVDRRTMDRTDRSVCDISYIEGLGEFIVSETMLKIASEYLGEVPVFGSAYLYISKPNDGIAGSQQFHFDGISDKEVQFVFAVTDIDEDCGPFTLFTADIAEKINNYIPISQYRKSDEEVFSILDPNKLKRMIGPAGTGWIVDTARCLHYGSRTKEKIRCHLQISYMSRFSPCEPVYEFLKFKGTLPNKLSKLQRMAVSQAQFITDR